MMLRDRLYEAVGEPGAPPPGNPPAPPAPDPRDAELERMRLALRSPAPDIPPPPDKKAVETAFWRDPLSVSTAIAQAAMQNNPGNDTLMEVAMGQARGADPEVQAIWDKYLPEIQANVATVAPQFRTNVQVWRNAFNFVKGIHFDEIFGERQSRNKSAALHTNDGPAAPGVRAPSGSPKTKLTEEESFISSSLGLTEDQYRHGKQIISEQHGKEKSPWDDAITIDSQSQRRANANAKRAKLNAA